MENQLINKPIDIIYAKDKFNGIGMVEDNKYKIPWNIPLDTKYFNNITIMTSLGLPNNNLMNAVIMGKNTWNSLNLYKPLPDRINIIISATLNIEEIKHYNNTFLCNNLLDGINLANTLNNVETIFIIGGKSIYNEIFKLSNFRYLYETIIHDNYYCNIKINNYYDKYIISTKTFLLKINNNNLNDFKKINVEFKKSINNKYKFVKEVINNILDNDNLNNIEEMNYINILEDLIINGEFRKTRNSNTWSLFNKSISFDLSKGFPLLTTKKVNFKAVFEELLWFLKGDTNAKHLEDKNIKIWNSNTTREFLDKNNLQHYDVYDIGPMYGFNLIHYNSVYKGMNYDYTGQGFNQIEYILNLIKNDPTSRRIIMTTFNPAQAKEGVLYPCHGLITQFYINKNKLDLVTYQRSVDIICGFPFNIASYALLTYLICEVVNNDVNYKKTKLIPGNMTIHLGDYHLYEDHYELAISQILRSPYKFPNLLFKNKKYNLTDFDYDDLELINYKSHKGIIAKMIA